MKIIDQLKKSSDKNLDNIDYTSKDFMDFITNAKTINLFIDGKGGLTEFIQNFITNDTLKSTITIDYETIGKMFLTLIFYKLNPNNYNDKEHSKILKLDKEQRKQATDLINLYNFTMINPYKKGLNGKNGGAPKNNTNAKKKKAATDYETDQDTDYNY